MACFYIGGSRLTGVQETKQLTLEEIDLLFGERALGTLPQNLDEKPGANVELNEMHADSKAT